MKLIYNWHNFGSVWSNCIAHCDRKCHACNKIDVATWFFSVLGLYIYVMHADLSVFHYKSSDQLMLIFPPRSQAAVAPG